jgi:phage gpG-like protein
VTPTGTTVAVKIEMKFPLLDQVFRKKRTELMLTLAAAMQTNRSMMFDKDGADNGKPKWKPLVLRQGRPLQKTGTLRKSFAPKNDGRKPARGKDTVLLIAGKKVTIGTSLAKARLLNDGTAKMPGGVLRPVHAKALKIPLGKSKFMFRASVRIPARPMDTVTAEDRREWAETMANAIAVALRTG